jgi:putative heme-binding domain-containing protein
MSDAHPALRRHAIRIAEAMAKDAPALVEAAAKLVSDPDAKVRMQLACSLGEWKNPMAGQALAELAVNNADEPYISAAVMSSAVPHYAAIVDKLLATPGSARGALYRHALNMALALDNRDAMARLLEPVVTPDASGGYTGDQVVGWSGYLNLLSSRNKTPEQLVGEKKDALAERIAQGHALTDAAREIAIDDTKSPAERAAAASLLGRDPKEAAGDLDLLTALLTPQTPPPVQRNVVRSIARAGGEKTPALLAANWAGMSPEIRGVSVDLLIANEPWAFELLKQVEAGKVSPGDIDVSRRKRLEKFETPRVKELAAKVLGETSNAARAKVVESYASALQLTGDVNRGLKLYTQNCAVCHKYGEQGNEIGPDLRSVRDWPADSILANTLDPNRKVEPRYLSYTATLNSGDVLFGVITNETGNSLAIKGLDGKETTVLRADVKSLEGSNRSLMPDGLEAALNKQQMADLIRFLKEPPEEGK